MPQNAPEIIVKVNEGISLSYRIISHMSSTETSFNGQKPWSRTGPNVGRPCFCTFLTRELCRATLTTSGRGAWWSVTQNQEVLDQSAGALTDSQVERPGRHSAVIKSTNNNNQLLGVSGSVLETRCLPRPITSMMIILLEKSWSVFRPQHEDII